MKGVKNSPPFTAVGMSGDTESDTDGWPLMLRVQAVVLQQIRGNVNEESSNGGGGGAGEEGEPGRQV